MTLIRYPKLFYIGLCCIIVLTNIEVTMVNLALPQIIQDFSLELFEAQAVISCYLLGALVFFLVCGYLGEKFSEIIVYRCGILLFLVGTFICGISFKPLILVIARIIQGIGFAACFSMSLVLMRSSFSKRQLPFLLGFTTMISGISQSMGPTLGAWILDLLSWRWIFFLKIPLIVAALLLSYIYKNKEVTNKQKRFDVLGMFLWSICVFSLFYMNEFESLFVRASLLINTLICGYLLYIHSYKTSEPFIPVSLFYFRTYKNSIFLRMLALFYFSSLLFLLPLYMQNILGYSPKLCSFFLLLMTLSYGITSLVYGAISKIRLISPFLGVFVLKISAIVMFMGIVYSSTTASGIGLTLAGMSFGILMPQSLQLSLEEVSKERYGVGMGLFCSLGFLGSFIGVWFSSLCLEIYSSYAFLDTIAIKGAQGISPLALVPEFLKANVFEAFTFGFELVLLLNIFFAACCVFCLKPETATVVNEG